MFKYNVKKNIKTSPCSMSLMLMLMMMNLLEPRARTRVSSMRALGGGGEERRGYYVRSVARFNRAKVLPSPWAWARAQVYSIPELRNDANSFQHSSTAHSVPRRRDAFYAYRMLNQKMEKIFLFTFRRIIRHQRSGTPSTTFGALSAARVRAYGRLNGFPGQQ